MVFERTKGLLKNDLESLRALLVEQMRDLYSAEKQIIAALPRMEKAAHSVELKQAFAEHLEETKHQKEKLEEAFRLLDENPGRSKCVAMEGIIKEGKEMIGQRGAPIIKDASLIAAAQRVEHYEMSGYGTARTLAYTVGEDEVAQLLQQILEEEMATDERLTEIAEQQLYPYAEQRAQAEA